MAARRIRPYRQGRLDGLCGLYALVNALRLLCPRLDEDACERVFCALVKARTRQTTSPLAVIADGLSRRELLQLFDRKPDPKLPGGASRPGSLGSGLRSNSSRFRSRACAASGAACVRRWRAEA